jgi:acylphosphatase
MNKIAIHVLISGIVQGVGYRFSTVKKAQKLGLNGWVRNLADTRVEALFEGEQNAVEQMLQWCHIGPASAVVDHIEIEQINPQGIQGFEIKY